MPHHPGQDILVIDGHSDLLSDVEARRRSGAVKVIETEYLPDLLAGGVSALIASVFVDDAFLPEMALRIAMRQIGALHQELDESPDKLKLCTTGADVLDAHREGKVGLVLSFEGAEPLGTDLSVLRAFHRLGVRGIGLTWSRRNQVADGSSYLGCDRKGGLTGFGVELVQEAERLGMFLDASHLSDGGLDHLLAVATRPFLASHSNARTLCGTMRNLDDGQLRELARRGCLVGVNAASLLVAERDEEATMDRLLDHADHLVALMGPDHVAIGFDLCDRIMACYSQEMTAVMPRRPFDIVKGHRSTGLFLEGLRKRGHGEGAIRKIAGENLCGFLSALGAPGMRA
ncbi:MAG TPA: membrane dipeptidase [Holophaga sp.]|nr:membrane dipeptidase [Holophaga sp.]HPS67374.1 membrane dipeptidase [Holophaga sp.]